MGNSEIHRTLHQLFGKRDFDGMDSHLRADVVYEDIPRGLTTKGPDEFKDWLAGWTAAFSDARVESAIYHEGAGFSLARFVGRGVNDGPMGPLPATNKQMSTPFWELLHFDDDGKVIAGEINYDQLTLLAQLGHVTPPG